MIRLNDFNFDTFKSVFMMINKFVNCFFIQNLIHFINRKEPQVREPFVILETNLDFKITNPKVLKED